MTTETKHLWEYDHPYYAEEGCYYAPSHEAHANWDSWEEFKDAWGSNDPDRNLLYRWDWSRADPEDYEWAMENEEGFELPGDTLKLYYMLQRKAKPFSHHIQVTEEDESDVRAWLKERSQTVRDIWEPML